MKCINEISCQGNDNDYQGMFSLIFFMALSSYQSLINPINLRDFWPCDVYFVCGSQKTYSHEKKRESCLFVLVVP